MDYKCLTLDLDMSLNLDVKTHQIVGDEWFKENGYSTYDVHHNPTHMECEGELIMFPDKDHVLLGVQKIVLDASTETIQIDGYVLPNEKANVFAFHEGFDNVKGVFERYCNGLEKRSAYLLLWEGELYIKPQKNLFNEVQKFIKAWGDLGTIHIEEIQGQGVRITGEAETLIKYGIAQSLAEEFGHACYKLRSGKQSSITIRPSHVIYI